MTGAQIAAAALTERAPGQARQLAFRGLMLGAIGVALVFLVVLVADVLRDGAGTVSPQLLTEQPSKIRPESSGLQSALVGTLYLMAICALVVIPVGIMTALYLEEYADRTRWWNRVIEINIQNLASVPSVIYGILGLAFIVRGPFELGPSVRAGAITLALLVLPVVIIVAREAIRAVPPSIRAGAMALGATTWQTIWRQVLPGSIAGIATGVILALSRAIGETAPLLILGAAISARVNPSLDNEVLNALPLQIFNWTREADQASFLPLAAAAILVLMGVLLVMNSVAIVLRNRYEQKW